MDTSILRKAGLTESQAKGYLALIEHGELSPTELADKTNESRTNGYMICEKLESLGLATKKDGRKVAYQPESPTKLKQLLVSRQRELKAADVEISSILPALLSIYRLTTDKPGVLYLEGVSSLRQIFDDIIKTGQTVRIFPSAYDRDDPEVAAMIDTQVERQHRSGIKTEVLLRAETFDQFALQNNKLFEARPADFGALDTQILIYGDNVALTTFNTGAVTTIITSPPVAETFRQLFEVQWQAAAGRRGSTDT